MLNLYSPRSMAIGYCRSPEAQAIHSRKMQALFRRTFKIDRTFGRKFARHLVVDKPLSP
jgi:hypothetical protein